MGGVSPLENIRMHDVRNKLCVLLEFQKCFRWNGVKVEVRVVSGSA